ncbi:MAG: hypothetical protein ACRYF3_12145 [Janthinobacterium lividum]
MAGSENRPHPASPWRGSAHSERHRWQLEHALDLPEIVVSVRDLAAQLSAAHTAGWWLLEPMHNGHLLAARASRRRRAQVAPAPAATPVPPPPLPREGGWRLRVLQGVPQPGEELFDVRAAISTPLLATPSRARGAVGGVLVQLGGPEVPAELLAEIARQLVTVAPGTRAQRWGLSASRVGHGFDLVAEGSPLRLHALHDGRLVRTRDVLLFQHTADGAADLEQAAVAYRRLATEVEAVIAAGGRLLDVDEGFVSIAYGDAAPAPARWSAR